MRQRLIKHIIQDINTMHTPSIVAAYMLWLLIVDANQGHHIILPEGENAYNMKGLTDPIELINNL